MARRPAGWRECLVDIDAAKCVVQGWRQSATVIVPAIMPRYLIVGRIGVREGDVTAHYRAVSWRDLDADHVQIELDPGLSAIARLRAGQKRGKKKTS
jgi:hypothetical protein